MRDVILATRSRVEPRAVGPTALIGLYAFGILRTRRYVYGQDIRVVGSAEGLHYPSSLSWLKEDRPRHGAARKCGRPIGRVRATQYGHVGLVDQLHHVVVARHWCRDGQACLISRLAWDV